MFPSMNFASAMIHQGLPIVLIGIPSKPSATATHAQYNEV
jgi:hypothetical protein